MLLAHIDEWAIQGQVAILRKKHVANEPFGRRNPLFTLNYEKSILLHPMRFWGELASPTRPKRERRPAVLRLGSAFQATKPIHLTPERFIRSNCPFILRWFVSHKDAACSVDIASRLEADERSDRTLRT